MKLPEPGGQLVLAEAPVDEERCQRDTSPSRFALGTYMPPRATERVSGTTKDWIAAANGQQRLFRVMLPSVGPTSRPASARRGRQRSDSRDHMHQLAARIDALATKAEEQLPQPREPLHLFGSSLAPAPALGAALAPELGAERGAQSSE